MRLFALSASALALAFVACNNSTAPDTIADRLTGTWSQDGLSTFESSFTMVLAAHDTTVTGTGNYSFEAGRHGTVTVTGVIESPNVLLTVTYDYGDVAHFSGQLQGPAALRGSWRTVSDPVLVSFTKLAH